jgi:hypothetical protein
MPIRNETWLSRLWNFPTRDRLNDARIRKVISPSPEEQRLTQIYLKKGLPGLIEELKKY